MTGMLYDEGFTWLEEKRWSFNEDIAWDKIDHAMVNETELNALRLACLAEFTALDATMMFLRDFKTDIDFSCFMSIWFYEEMKHHLVLKRYLKEFDIEMDTDALGSIHQDLPEGGMINTLTMHMLGEIKLHNWYVKGHKYFREPVLKRIFQYIAADELRHGQMYFRFLERKIAEDPSIVGQILRMARFLVRDEGGAMPKHPVPQLVKSTEAFNFAEAFNNVFTSVDMTEAKDKSERMGYHWLSRLTGYEIKDMDSLTRAIKEERRGGMTAHRVQIGSTDELAIM